MASEYIDRQQSMTTRCVFVILLLLTHNVPHKNRSKVVQATEKHISATPFAGNKKITTGNGTRRSMLME